MATAGRTSRISTSNAGRTSRIGAATLSEDPLSDKMNAMQSAIGGLLEANQYKSPRSPSVSAVNGVRAVDGIIDGELEISNGSQGRWAESFFELDSDYLHQFLPDARRRQRGPVASFELTSMEGLSLKVTGSNGPFEFIFHSGGKPVKLRAKTADGSKAWVKALRERRFAGLRRILGLSSEFGSDGSSSSPTMPLTVMIVSAMGLPPGVDPCCVARMGCDDSGFRGKTEVCQDTSDPGWYHEFCVWEYAIGEPLKFIVFNRSKDILSGGSPTSQTLIGRPDDLIGTCWLPAETFFPSGFDGKIEILHPGQPSAYLHVKVKACATCPATGQPLTAIGTSQDDGWKCDGSHCEGGCKSGITSFHQTHLMNRFVSKKSNYDLCELCFKDMSRYPATVVSRRFSGEKASSPGSPTYYMPKFIRGSQILVPVGENQWRLDNTALKSSSPGICYRRTKNLSDRHERGPAWGDHIEGLEEEEGWVRCIVKGRSPRSPQSPRSPPSSRALESPRSAAREAKALGKTAFKPGGSPTSAGQPRSASVPVPQEVNRAPDKARLNGLYDHARMKENRLKERRQIIEAEEMRQIEADKEALRKQCGKPRQEQYDPDAASKRLFQDSHAKEARMKFNKQAKEEEEDRAIEKARFRQAHDRPRSASTPKQGAEATTRLYMHAKDLHTKREKMDKEKLGQEVQSPAGPEEKRAAKVRTDRLYELHNKKQMKLQQKKKESSEKEEASRKEQDVSTNSRRRHEEEPDFVFNHLHEDWQKRQNRVKERMNEHNAKAMQEIQEIKDAQRRPQPDPDSPPRWARLYEMASTPRAGQEKSVRTADETSTLYSTPPVTPGRAALMERVPEMSSVPAAVITIIHERLGIPLPMHVGELWFNLACEVQNVQDIYREIHHKCDRRSGYKALCQLAPQRLFRGNLVPESDYCKFAIAPDPLMQEQESLDELLSIAEAAQLRLQEIIAPNFPPESWLQGEVPKPSAVPMAVFAVSSGVKPREACKCKALVLYGPTDGDRRYKHLLDIARVTVVFNSYDMVMLGLETILNTFDGVLQVKNYFRTPGRLGRRYIKIVLQVQVAKPNGGTQGNRHMVSHKCEVRLEELAYFQPQDDPNEHLEKIDKIVCSMYTEAIAMERSSLVYLTRSVLARPPASHEVRLLRRKLSTRYGSCIAALRECNDGRAIPFDKFREMCTSVDMRTHSAKLWTELLMGGGNSLSIFDLDPLATVLLVRFRAHLLALGGKTNAAGAEQGDSDWYNRLFKQERHHYYNDHDQSAEFKNSLLQFGFSKATAGDILASLSRNVGKTKTQKFGVIAREDLEWLRKIDLCVDTTATTLGSTVQPLHYLALTQNESEHAKAAVRGRFPTICAATWEITHPRSGRSQLKTMGASDSGGEEASVSRIRRSLSDGCLRQQTRAQQAATLGRTRDQAGDDNAKGTAKLDGMDEAWQEQDDEALDLDATDTF